MKKHAETLIAAEILDLEPEQVAELPNIGLADSALVAPRGGFGDVPTVERIAAGQAASAEVVQWIEARTGST